MRGDLAVSTSDKTGCYSTVEFRVALTLLKR